MVGVDHQALEVLPEAIEVTALMGAGTKDIGLPVPRQVHTVLIDEVKSVDAALNALYRHDLSGFGAVYAYDDPAMMTAAAIGAVLGIRAVPASVVALFRDKYLQKQRLHAAGVPVTRHEFIEDIRELPPGYELPFAAAVVKPVSGQATVSTFVARSTADLARISRDCRARNVAARNFIIEEFVDGEEWFADGIVSEGVLRFASLGRYAKNCLTAVNERTPVRTFCLDPDTDKTAYDAAMPVVRQALAALGLRDGIFHMELFHHDGRVVFSECAARRAGGPIRDQIRHKFGVDLAYYGVQALLEPVGDIPVQLRDGVVASSFLPLVEGTVLDHPDETELAAQEGVLGARMFVPRGFRAAPQGASTFGRMGEFTVHAESESLATQRLDEIAQWFADRLVVLPLAPTMRELRSLKLR